MNTRAALVYLVGGFLTSACFLRPIGVVRAQGPSSSLDWTVRSWLWNYPVTEDYAMWDTGDPTEEQVGELVRYGHAFMEAVVFLHEHNISHGDIILQNMVMDVLLSDDYKTTDPLIAGVRGPERRYAFIDFQTAKVDDDPEILQAAVKKDVAYLASSLEAHLRCIEDVIPKIGPLFDSMKDGESEEQPTAAAALS
ncbi:hypothetical protein CPB85DRAFT_1566952 [Mucidula mucida]|nr:hypothetical protein CPB85DRAFT_1566952 [Mucidula mucida]